MTHSAENYLKTIYHLSQASPDGVSTNAIAAMLDTKASSVTDMIKKLAERDLILYQKYQGVVLTEEGKMAAKMIVRKHRLWEVFLVEILDFSWDEVHEIAEELEHIKSEKLIEKLSAFLNHPTLDPHGDPIPNSKGEIPTVDKKLLSEIEVGKDAVCVGVKDTSTAFLKYLNKNGIALGENLKILSKEEFDGSMVLKVGNQEITISNKIANNLFVKKK